MIDPEVIMSPGFIILAGGSVSAMLIGWKMSGGGDIVQLPLLGLGLGIVVMVIASYIFAARQ
ncbi:hypothetical protein LCGC14_0571100 [marine sediment metagenome]|uniref:Uncharacterized protein n=1 Tax=marine sediment metagenome TaxID=412755 RepID=A0A0F9S2R8_9ZZZZ